MATYAHVIKILAALFGASEKETLGPIRGRLQNFQRLGIPLGLKIGKGKKIDYQSEQIYQLAFCLELADAGVIPSQIEYVIKEWWESDIYKHFKDEMASPNAGGKILILAMRQMVHAWPGRTPDSLFDGFVITGPGGDKTFAEVIGDLRRKGWRHAILIDLTEIVRCVEKHRAAIPEALAEIEK
jgi:hypothetical protein